MAEIIGMDASVSKEVSCKGCGARIRYYANDVQEYQIRDYTGDSDTLYEIKCPGCGYEIRVKPF